jgi:hypothetical protein
MSHDQIKAAARQRMAQTGESYSTARREVIKEYKAAQRRMSISGTRRLADLVNSGALARTSKIADLVNSGALARTSKIAGMLPEASRITSILRDADES